MKWITHQTAGVGAALALHLPLEGVVSACLGAILPDKLDQAIAKRSRNPQRTFNQIHRGTTHWFGWWVAILLVAWFVVLAAVCLLAARTLLPADREDPPLFPAGFSVASPGLLTPAVMGLFLLTASGVLDLLFGFSGASALTEAPASIATLTKDDLLNLLG